MLYPVKNLFSFFLKCTFAKRNDFFWKAQTKPEDLPEKEPFSQPEHMKFEKLKFGTFMNKNSSASSPAVWIDERIHFSAPRETLWSYSCFHLQMYGRQVQMGSWRLALGWEHLFTPDVCQRIAGGQHRILPTIVNKTWFEATEGKKLVYGPTCRYSSWQPRLWMQFKRRWCYEQVVCHLPLAPRQEGWGSHEMIPKYRENETFGK